MPTRARATHRRLLGRSGTEGRLVGTGGAATGAVAAVTTPTVWHGGELASPAVGYEIKRFPYDGAVDADGHVLEPATLWEDYLEARYRPRAMRIRQDEHGLEYLE